MKYIIGVGTINKKIINISATAVLLLSSIGGALPLILSQKAAADSVTVVTPASPGGWSSVESTTGGTVSFVTDSSSPSGSGALELTTDSTTTSKAHYMDYFTPIALSSIGNSLGYATKQNSASFIAGDPAYQLGVYLNGGTSGFTTLTYEPYVDQGNAAVTTGSWQTWNVGAGKFYTSHTLTSSTNGNTITASEGSSTYTLAEIRADFPNAVVYGVGVNVGSNNPSYDVEADNLTFNGVTYDFEPTSYTNDPSQSQFTANPVYVRANNDGDIAAIALVPQQAQSARFTFTQTDGTNVYTNVPGVEHTQAGQFPVPSTGQHQYRVGVSADPGTYTVTGEYEFDGTWYPITGQATTYVLGNPSATFVYPTSTNHYFRPSDNPLRVTVSDINDSFRDVVFTIGSTNYTVNRADCDLREAGNHLLCDINAASNWTDLNEGTYTATATVYNQASNHVTITSPSFTVDGTLPALTNLQIANPQTVYSNSVTVSADATDNGSGINNVTFYLTAPRAGDGVCDGNGTQLTSAQGTLSSGSTYTATLDTSSLNGPYCINAVAEDNATNHSAILRQAVTFDNSAPAEPSATFTADNTGTTVNSGGVTNSKNFTFNLSNPVGDTVTRYQLKYWNNIPGSAFNGESNAWNPTDLSGYSSSLGVYHDQFTQGDGTHYFAFSACDAAGNCSGYSTPFVITYDATAPVVTVDTQNTPDTTPTLTGTVDDSTATVSAVVNGQTYAATVTGNTWSANVTTALTPGTYDVVATATDPAGNIGHDSTTDELTITAASSTSTTTTTISNVTTNTNKVHITNISTQTSHTGNATSTGNANGGATSGNASNSNQAVLGTSTTNGEVKGASTTTPNTVTLSNAKKADHKSFLGLGWWWLPVLLVVALFVYLFGRRRTNQAA